MPLPPFITSATVQDGSHIRLGVTPLDSSNNLGVEAPTPIPTWTSDHPEIANPINIAQDGLSADIFGVAPGLATITVTGTGTAAFTSSIPVTVQGGPANHWGFSQL